MAEGRRHGRVHREAADLAALDAPEHGHEAIHVHCLGQAVADGFPDQRMVGQGGLFGHAPHVVLAGQRGGKHRRQQVFRAHPLDLRGHAPSVSEAQQGQRAACVPAPAAGKHGRGQHGLDQHVTHGVGAEESEDRLQREAVPLAEREDESLVRGGGLELLVERRAEALPQREAPGAVQPPAEGGVQDQLHPAPFVEESFRNDRLLCRHGSEDRAASRHVGSSLLGPPTFQATLRLQPVH